MRPDLTDEEVAHLLWTTNSTAFYRLATSGGRGPGDYAAMVLDLWTPHAPRREQAAQARHPIRGPVGPLVALTTAVRTGRGSREPR